jgi:predicted Ser/Thr protein kinase
MLAMPVPRYIEAPDRYRFGEHRFRRVGRLKKDFFSCNELLEDEQGQIWVLKVSRFLYLAGYGREPARFLSRREQAFYRQLQGIEGIPRLHQACGPNFLLHAFIPGQTLQQRREVDARFFAQLEQLLAAIHARGIAAVDISKKANIIVGDDGKPYLIDFQISAGRTSYGGPLAEGWNALVEQLMAEDRYHLLKHKRRICPELLSAAELAESRRKSRINRVYRAVLGRPFLAAKRRVFPHGSHELYLFRRPADAPPDRPGG